MTTGFGIIPEYLKLFDAIAQEAIYYDGGGDPGTGEKSGAVAVDPEDSQEYVNNLKNWQQGGEPVFNVESGLSYNNYTHYR